MKNIAFILSALACVVGLESDPEWDKMVRIRIKFLLEDLSHHIPEKGNMIDYAGLGM